MDITEKSKEYAKGVSLEAITSALEKAYADGFKDGMDYQANKKVIDAETGVTYVDLGLPSGTLWASDYVRGTNFTYEEASKLNIPTSEQYKELYKECFVDYYLSTDLHGIRFTGVNGNSIIIRYAKVDQAKREPDANDTFFFWLKDESKNKEKLCAGSYYKGDNLTEFPYSFTLFMGIRVPVMLVK